MIYLLGFLGLSFVSSSCIASRPSLFGMFVYSEVTSRLPIIVSGDTLCIFSILFMKSVVSFT